MKLLGKCLFLFSALLILQGTVFATGGAEPPGGQELVTISIMSHGSYLVLPYGPEKNKEGRWKVRAREEFGIDFDLWDWTGDENAMFEKLNLLFATGDYPEVIDFRVRYYNDWARQGVLLNIEQFLDKVPNYRKIWTDEEWDLLYRARAADDGNLYAWEGNWPAAPARFWIYRKTAFDKMGLECPTTTDQLLQVLKVIKKENPDSLPFGTRGKGEASYIYGYFTFPFRIMGNCYDPDTGDFVGVEQATDKYRDMMKYFNTMYAEGYIDPAIATNKRPQNEANFANAKTYIWFSWPNRANWAEELQKKVVPDVKWVVSEKLITAYPDKKCYYQARLPFDGFAVTLTDKLKGEKLDRMLKLIDYQCTEEGARWSGLGAEGVHYSIDDKGVIQPFEKYNIWGPDYDNLNDPRKQDQIDHAAVAQSKAFFAWFMRENPYPKIIMEDPANEPQPLFFPRLTEEEGKKLADLSIIWDKTTEWYLKFLLGMEDPNDDAVWSEYLGELKKAGLDEVVQIRKTAFDRTYGK